MPTYLETLERLAKGASAQPVYFDDGTLNFRRRKFNYAYSCQSPVTIELNARPTTRNHKYVRCPDDGMSMTLEMEVKCRKCPNCLKARAHHWRLRAIAEYNAAHALDARTWFGTLTINPDRRFLILNEARRHLARQGVDFDALPSEEIFAEKHKIISKEITRFVKRIRKNSGSSLRLLCVAEVHKDGEPHYHLLIHEQDNVTPIRKKVLDAAWSWGFSQFRLASDKRQVTYLCKYLTKSSMARVRASINYGETTAVIAKLEKLKREHNDHPK